MIAILLAEFFLNELPIESIAVPSNFSFNLSYGISVNTTINFGMYFVSDESICSAIE